MDDGAFGQAGFGAEAVDGMEARVVRYADLRPCRNAFIDTRSPGSEEKENFTVIGPGVSENPAQHVHISEPHGFNIGGARQPPGCLNSQHSHLTAETIVVHSGQWRFDFGETGQDAQVTLGPGDVLSAPTHVFRGFTNVGSSEGYLFFVLGHDDPGRVTWAPQVFELAQQHGLVLLESGSLVDTVAGETVPTGQKPQTPTSGEEVAALRRLSPAEAEAVAVRDTGLREPGESLLIGPGAPLDWPHGFTLSRAVVRRGQADPVRRLDVPEVVFVQEGVVDVEWEQGSVRLGPGDTVSVPRGASRRVASPELGVAFIVRGGDALPAGTTA